VRGGCCGSCCEASSGIEIEEGVLARLADIIIGLATSGIMWLVQIEVNDTILETEGCRPCKWE
jgi:hypothetical protein